MGWFDGSGDGNCDGKFVGACVGEGVGAGVRARFGYSDGAREGKQDGVDVWKIEGAVVEHPLITWLVFNEPRVGVPLAAHVKDEASHPSPVKYQCAVFGRPATIVVGV